MRRPCGGAPVVAVLVGLTIASVVAEWSSGGTDKGTHAP